MRNKDLKLTIKSKIDLLSHNDDERQDLWVSYLEDPECDFSSKLLEIKNKNEEKELIIFNIVHIMSSHPSPEMIELLDNFTELERSVLILIALGFNKEQISKYKMIDAMRLQQLMDNLSTHPIWEKFLAKEKTKCRRKIRADV
jgi:hypothetical protein